MTPVEWQMFEACIDVGIVGITLVAAGMILIVRERKVSGDTILAVGILVLGNTFLGAMSFNGAYVVPAVMCFICFVVATSYASASEREEARRHNEAHEFGLGLRRRMGGFMGE